MLAGCTNELVQDVIQTTQTSTYKTPLLWINLDDADIKFIESCKNFYDTGREVILKWPGLVILASLYIYSGQYCNEVLTMAVIAVPNCLLNTQLSRRPM